jgi:hypothetical protein
MNGNDKSTETSAFKKCGDFSIEITGGIRIARNIVAGERVIAQKRINISCETLAI